MPKQPVSSSTNGRITQFFQRKPSPPSTPFAPSHNSRAGLQTDAEGSLRPFKRARVADYVPSEEVDVLASLSPCSSPLTRSHTGSSPGPSFARNEQAICEPSTLSANWPDAAMVVEGAAPEKAHVSTSSSFLTRSSQSARRLLSNGEEVVKGSDTEGDDSDELEDISALYAKFEPKPKPTVSSFNPTASSKPMDTRSRPGDRPQASSKKPEPKYTYDIKKILAITTREAAMEARLAAAQAQLDMNQDARQLNELQRSPKKDAMHAADAMRSALAEAKDTEDAGRARRVMDALVRTEAFERLDVWHFFQRRPPPTKKPFPHIRHKDKVLSTALNDPARREQLLLSGYLKHIAPFAALPDELLSWMMGEICGESRAALVASYVEILRLAARHESPWLSAASLSCCYDAVGTRPDAMDFTQPLTPARHATRGDEALSLANLSSFLDLLAAIGQALQSDTRDSALLFLIRASFDQCVLQDAPISQRVQAALEILLQSYSDGDEANELLRISKITFRTITSPVLREQLISALPCGSKASRLFRRRLAFAFTLGKARALSLPLENIAHNSRVLLLFAKGAPLRITSDTNYLELKARLSMLDIAIAAGFSDLEFLKSRDKAAEKEFNAKIDLIAEAIRELMARIVDHGAAFMRRTEAKAEAERLAQRLENGVRTRERPRKDWFGQKDLREGQSAMQSWMRSASGNGDQERHPQEDRSAKLCPDESAERGNTHDGRAKLDKDSPDRMDSGHERDDDHAPSRSVTERVLDEPESRPQLGRDSNDLESKHGRESKSAERHKTVSPEKKAVLRQPPASPRAPSARKKSKMVLMRF